MEEEFAIRSLAISGAAWTPFVCPFMCDNVVLINRSSGPVSLRSDDSNAASELVLDLYSEIILNAPRHQSLGCRYKYGQTIAFFKATDGNNTGPVIGIFQR